MTKLRQNIPEGKFRVIGVDLFDHGRYIVGDFETKEEAFVVADKHNKRRTNSLDDVYYAYDDKGNYLRGNEAVNGPGVSP